MGVNIKFISDLNYQIKAVNSTIELFDGTFAKPKEVPLFEINANSELVSLEKLNNNLKHIQETNKIPQTEVTSVIGESLYDRPNFNVEMETGTGKTYVYIRTILELNRRYGLQKFIIVVPSVAIREGVLANLRLTKPHFQKVFDRISYIFRVF
jgi:type III restriction enzyme